MQCYGMRGESVTEGIDMANLKCIIANVIAFLREWFQHGHWWHSYLEF